MFCTGTMPRGKPIYWRPCGFYRRQKFPGFPDSELPGFGKEKAHLILTFEAAGRVQEAELTIVRRRQAVLNGVVQPSPSRLADSSALWSFSGGPVLGTEGAGRPPSVSGAAYCQLRPGYIATLSEYHPGPWPSATPC